MSEIYGNWNILFVLQVLNLFLALLIDSFQNFHEDDKPNNHQGKKAVVGQLLKKLKTRNKEKLSVTRKKRPEKTDLYDLPTTASEESSSTPKHSPEGNLNKSNYNVLQGVLRSVCFLL